MTADSTGLRDRAARQASSLDYIASNAVGLSEVQRQSVGAGAEYIRALLASPAPAGAEGWVLVPKEPTFEMLDAALPNEAHKTASAKRGDLIMRYEAMLAAAPHQPPASPAPSPAEEAQEFLGDPRKCVGIPTVATPPAEAREEPSSPATSELVVALRRLVDEYENYSDERSGEPSCPICTDGATPNDLNKGPCAYHHAKALLAKAAPAGAEGWVLVRKAALINGYDGESQGSRACRICGGFWIEPRPEYHTPTCPIPAAEAARSASPAPAPATPPAEARDLVERLNEKGDWEANAKHYDERMKALRATEELWMRRAMKAEDTVERQERALREIERPLEATDARLSIYGVVNRYKAIARAALSPARAKTAEDR